MSETSLSERSERTEGVVPALQVATREDHIAGGTLHLFPEFWLPGEHVPNPDTDPEEGQSDA